MGRVETQKITQTDGLSMLIGFDPGRDKCGVAITSDDGAVCHRSVVSAADVETVLTTLCQTYGPISQLVMGNQTTSRQWGNRLRSAFPNIDIQLVDERFSSQEARQRYWSYYPPRGWARLLPQGLRVPPHPIDDIVAEILIERFLHQQSSPPREVSA